jgi:hypothetical protein
MTIMWDEGPNCKCGHRKASHDRDYCFYCECSRYRVDAKIPRKMSTRQFRDRLLPRSTTKGAMCWGNVLEALGVTYTPTGKGELTGKINLLISRGGYEVTYCQLADVMPGIPQASGYTLAVFLGDPEHLKGTWVIYLNRHVLCVCDGKITDTMGWAQTVSRRIESVYRVTRRSEVVYRVIRDNAG